MNFAYGNKVNFAYGNEVACEVRRCWTRPTDLSSPCPRGVSKKDVNCIQNTFSRPCKPYSSLGRTLCHRKSIFALYDVIPFWLFLVPVTLTAPCGPP